jgi:biotin carboxyl carrier protein
VMWYVEVGGRTRRVEARGSDVLLDGRRMDVDTARLGDVVSLVVGPSDPGAATGRCGRSYEVAVAERGSGDLLVSVNGRSMPVRASLAAGRAGNRATRTAGRRDGDISAGPHRVVAPMPGRIAKVLVKVGDAVAARQGLVVVEAMKMENELRSPRAGTVVEIRVVEGARVESQALLVVVG